MTCAACEAAHANPLSGRSNAACFECSARAIARSPQFHASVIARARTPEYNAELERVFGVAEEDQRRGHEAASTWARRIRQATKEQTT